MGSLNRDSRGLSDSDNHGYFKFQRRTANPQTALHSKDDHIQQHEKGYECVGVEPAAAGEDPGAGDSVIHTSIQSSIVKTVQVTLHNALTF